MSFENELLEIEEAIDVFAELRSKHEQNGRRVLVVLELTRLELSLHERARSLRNQNEKSGAKKRKPEKSQPITRDEVEDQNNKIQIPGGPNQPGA